MRYVLRELAFLCEDNAGACDESAEEHEVCCQPGAARWKDRAEAHRQIDAAIARALATDAHENGGDRDGQATDESVRTRT